MFFFNRISYEDVLANPDNFNSNNHGQRPNDYWQKLEETEAKFWIYKFHQYQTLILKKEDVAWMIGAAKIGATHGQISRLHLEDLEWTLDRYPKDLGGSYFVRSDKNSLKYGKHKAGPYQTFKQVIESMITSIATHTPLPFSPEECTLYLIPWNEQIKPEKEFRAFVHKRKVKAISQATLKKTPYDEETFKRWFLILFDFCKEIIEKISLDDFTIDLVMLPEDKPHFIEINPFGAPYAAGSALFHWVLDEKVLYSNEDKVEFRWIE